MVALDAKPDVVSFYRQYGFMAFGAFEGASPGRPPSMTMFLAVRGIEMAVAQRKS